MPWLQVETAAGQRDPETIEDALSELGAAAVWLRDAGDEPVLEPAPGETPGWSETLITALFTTDLAEAELRAALEDCVPGIEWRFVVVEDRDWQAEFEQTLQPMKYGERLWVIPVGTQAPREGAVVQLSPGMAFGTGEHPTTAMCLRWLAGQQLGDLQVLDYGCGSGLLGIAAAKLGAVGCCAVDIDPQALDASRENAVSNSVTDQLIIVKPDVVPAGAQYDVLVANILSGTLIDLGPTLCDLVRPDAPLALTGILAHQADEVAAAWSGWADLTVGDQDGDWVLLSGSKRSKERGN